LSVTSTNLTGEVSDDYFIQVGTDTFSVSAGVSQLFGHDANSEMASATTRILTEFLNNKDTDLATKKLEIARQAHHSLLLTN